MLLVACHKGQVASEAQTVHATGIIWSSPVSLVLLTHGLSCQHLY